MIEVTAAIIRKDGKILICQRPNSKACGLLWEFPGGKTEVGESGKACVIRECQEELDVVLHVMSQAAETTYVYPDRSVHIRFYFCRIAAGTPVMKEHRDIRWVTPEELGQFPFCPADKAVIEDLMRSFHSHDP